MKCKCTKCGAENPVTKNVLAKRVLKAGSLEKVNATYLCRNCRSSKSVTKVVEEKKDKEAIDVEATFKSMEKKE